MVCFSGLFGIQVSRGFGGSGAHAKVKEGAVHPQLDRAAPQELAACLRRDFRGAQNALRLANWDRSTSLC